MPDTDPLLDAVDSLTLPRRTKLLRDDGSSDSVSIPALYQQLVQALPQGSDTGETGGAFGSRLPLAVDIRDTLADWNDLVRHTLRTHRLTPHKPPEPEHAWIPVHRWANRTDIRWYPKRDSRRPPCQFRTNLMQLAGALDDQERDMWARQVAKWTVRAQELLGMVDDQKPRRVRDTLCPTCLASHVRVDEKGDVLRGPAPRWVETFLAPSLLMRFVDSVLQSVECSICGAAWFGQSGIWRVGELLDEQRRAFEAVQGGSDTPTVAECCTG